jgi:hypothetical protein
VRYGMKFDEMYDVQRARMAGMSAKQSLDGFLTRYDPAIAKTAREALKSMRKMLPGAMELVYDNYNALGIGFSASERASNVVLSLVLYPRWVSLFFFQGASLRDPAKRLKGAGSRIRHIVLEAGAATLAEPAVQDLIRQALAKADPPMPGSGRGRIIIKSISARQRPRRPGAASESKRRAKAGRSAAD